MRYTRDPRASASAGLAEAGQPRRRLKGPCKELEARPELLHNGPCTVIYSIVDRIIDDYVAVLAAMDADLHQIEQGVFSPQVRQPAGRIYRHTREVLAFQRATVPLVDMLLHLAACKFPAVPTTVRVYFGGVEDRLQRVIEEVERNSALLASMLSANSSQLATRQADLALEQTRLALRQNEDMRRMSAWGGDRGSADVDRRDLRNELSTTCPSCVRHSATRRRWEPWPPSPWCCTCCSAAAAGYSHAAGSARDRQFQRPVNRLRRVILIHDRRGHLRA